MKFLVVGLGSMGKRRIRCLLALNQKKVAGFYKKLGFQIRGNVFYEAKIPHYKMVLLS